MSFYNMLFGRNAQTHLLLAVIGLRESDVERLRDVFVEDEGKRIGVHTRTGGGNRPDYPQEALYANPLFETTEDDDFDSTYATFWFRVPEEFASDVAALSAPLEHGIRPEFARHLARTIQREPTEGDKALAAYNAEAEALRRTEHDMANGHTFVPHDDAAMKEALELAEKNDGELRSTWGIMPLTLTVRRDFVRFPNARYENLRGLTRVDVDYEWTVDEDYWEHCRARFSEEFPAAMAKINEAVEKLRARAERKAAAR